MTAVVNLEWENQNSLRNYPFQAGCSLKIAGLDRSLPTSLLVDAFLIVSGSGDTYIYLESLELDTDLDVVLVFSRGDTRQPVATCTIPSTAVAQDSAEVVGLGLGTSGRLVVGHGIALVRQWGYGVYTMESPEEARLESSVASLLDMGVVTSVGIDQSTTTLVGDVKLEFGRVISGETDEEHNSVIINAVKLIEDCEETRLGCPLQSINGIKPDPYGNIVLTTEGIFTWSKGSNGITVSGIMDKEDCPIVFTPALRGTDGAAGAAGPRGPNGLNRLCNGGICCECEVCDTCELCDNPLSPPRVGGTSAGVGCVNETDTVTITGTDFMYTYPGPNNTTVEVPLVEGVTFCRSDGTFLDALLFNIISSQALEVEVPATLTTPPDPSNNYSVRVKTPWGWTNPVILCVNVGGGAPVYGFFDTFDGVGSWTDSRGPGFLFPVAGPHVEGLGCLLVTSILPDVTLNCNMFMDIIGASPWDFTAINTLAVRFAKEKDPGETFPPIDVLSFTLTDITLATQTFQTPIFPPFRYAAPYVPPPGSLMPISVALAAPVIDMSQIVNVEMTVHDFKTTIPLSMWVDGLEGYFFI